MSDVLFTAQLSVDDDGFLRRECPHCQREFKWLHGEPGEQTEPMPVGGYFCPYCCGRSEDGWWTRPQLAHIEAAAAGHAEQLLHDALKPLEQSSSDFVKISVTESPRSPIPPVPDEPNDMRRVDFSCHPAEPVKVLEDWDGAVHCLFCGQAA
jgi:hypothetical protein